MLATVSGAIVWAFVASSQHRSHFFLQVNGRSQVTQTLDGKCSFFTPRGIRARPRAPKATRRTALMHDRMVVELLSTAQPKTESAEDFEDLTFSFFHGSDLNWAIAL